MATDQPFDLNDPRNLEPFYSEEEIQGMDEAAMLEALNGIWKNFCISDAFEPGSTVKPMTVAAALQDHSILPSATFVCDGYQMFGDTRIRCSIFPGAHGEQTLAQAMAVPQGSIFPGRLPVSFIRRIVWEQRVQNLPALLLVRGIPAP